MHYKETAAPLGRRLRFFLPPTRQILPADQEADAACGTNFIATPFMQ